MRKSAGETIGVRVYVPQVAGSDGQLLVKGIQGSKSQSAFLLALIQRGWIELLHGTTAAERSIQCRSIGLPDELIAEIDALIPTPKLLELRSRDAQSLGAGAPAPAQAQPPQESPPEQAPPPNPLEPTPPKFRLPESSRLGSFSEGGGLS